MNTPPGITGLLVDWRAGNQNALERLLPLVEKELHRIARRQRHKIFPGDTLQTTALINEAYIRLVDQKNVSWQNRAHFFAIAASLMRRVLLNYIRDRQRDKRGGKNIQVSLSEAMAVTNDKNKEILALDEALNHLAQTDPRKARVVELRYFGGLSVEETAEALGISKITVMRDWNMAKALLAKEISHG